METQTEPRKRNRKADPVPLRLLLQRAREAAGKSIEFVADQLRVSSQTVRRIERGDTALKIEVAEQYAQLFGLDIQIVRDAR